MSAAATPTRSPRRGSTNLSPVRRQLLGESTTAEAEHWLPADAARAAAGLDVGARPQPPTGREQVARARFVCSANGAIASRTRCLRPDRLLREPAPRPPCGRPGRRLRRRGPAQAAGQEPLRRPAGRCRAARVSRAITASSSQVGPLKIGLGQRRDRAHLHARQLQPGQIAAAHVALAREAPPLEPVVADPAAVAAAPARPASRRPRAATSAGGDRGDEHLERVGAAAAAGTRASGRPRRAGALECVQVEAAAPAGAPAPPRSRPGRAVTR